MNDHLAVLLHAFHGSPDGRHWLDRDWHEFLEWAMRGEMISGTKVD